LKEQANKPTSQQDARRRPERSTGGRASERPSQPPAGRIGAPPTTPHPASTSRLGWVVGCGRHPHAKQPPRTAAHTMPRAAIDRDKAASSKLPGRPPVFLCRGTSLTCPFLRACLFNCPMPTKRRTSGLDVDGVGC
jgi:hypothetical protein